MGNPIKKSRASTPFTFEAIVIALLGFGTPEKTAAESLHTNQSGRDVPEHHLRSNPTQLIEDKVICYVQRFVLQIPEAGLHFVA
jgi:hypothetical protein